MGELLNDLEEEQEVVEMEQLRLHRGTQKRRLSWSDDFWTVFGCFHSNYYCCYILCDHLMFLYMMTTLFDKV